MSIARYGFAWWLIGCGQVASRPDAPAVADAALDVPVDQAPPLCDPTGAFDAPATVMGLGLVDAGGVRLSPDELTIYFSRGADLFTATRANRTDAFGTPRPLAVQNTMGSEVDPSVTSDGRTLWFASGRIATEGPHLYVATRSSTLAEFGMPGIAGVVNASDPAETDLQPFITAGDDELWFTSSRPGTQGLLDIWRAPRNGGSFATPVIVPELNSPAEDWLPVVSDDRLTVYLASNRTVTGTRGNFEIYASHRSVASDGFPPPRLVAEVNSEGTDFRGWLSPDNCRLYGSRTPTRRRACSWRPAALAIRSLWSSMRTAIAVTRDITHSCKRSCFCDNFASSTSSGVCHKPSAIVMMLKSINKIL